jgi:hypothetical protein
MNNAVVFIRLFSGLLAITTESRTGLVLLIASQVVCGERSESENWSSVRASNEGLKEIDDSRNMNMKRRVKLFIFAVHTTKRERCTNN